ncbi:MULTISPECIES: type II toxin-antitoxin system YafQ family toxin [unclassified Mesorhizobium]|uniref:type II toxin-antitoxin system YafQ family toxin n=1 Tax=unclassified Mesorhizobium TaxID=325217 RepID=UPI001125F958|nr:MULTISPECIES: type II toxin-antitoxin system YafQ family toxin [unclassified Mesorhizobium]TPI56988.1 type II toxin-antitoxin system YafQ family toxin [Mesorhizobium sp. B3-1-1]TPJ72217.1 type II toxin-antitoxin system YafQ family toxin [Mesorhizobium sp. B2-6-7]TPJ88464.1 type II toxin-antitoxin system YafQ family toxin [Mesorhizobium sp. B2-6-3]TPK03546.1 type II toxin-antitoxin system YafQ family toxin [Mesorhizobium sp. B2-5-10]TPK13911.1 type II toxin-antitoxin system YafQ family toxin
MPTPVHSGQFRRDVKRMEKRGKDLAKLRELLGLLIAGLPARYKDHPLKGDWKDYRDAHVEPDWLLIYRIADDELRLARTGSYSDLFNE